MNPERQRRELAAEVEKLGIGHYQRHVLLCAGPECCDSDKGDDAWDALKQAIKAQCGEAGGPSCFRTRVKCLRVCSGGPLLVVYPEGTWYHGMTARRMDRFVREHLVLGRPVREWIFADNPLPLAGPPQSDQEPNC